jgi:acetylornithine aminotransferase
VVTLAKGLGGGLPLGAALAFGDSARLLRAGEHASTFGGNPVSCAAGLAVLTTLAAEDLPGRAKVLGEHIAASVTALGHPLVDHVRGAGLLLGVELVEDHSTKAPVPPATVRRLVAALARRGVLVAGAGSVLRITPPLVIEEDMALAGVALLDEALSEVEAA